MMSCVSTRRELDATTWRRFIASSPPVPSYVIFRPAWLERAGGLEAGKEGQYGSGLFLRLAACQAPSIPAEARLNSAVGSEVEDSLALCRWSN